jgi:Ser/Thr protein kinase RdoA (MazF antagonist)
VYEVLQWRDGQPFAAGDRPRLAEIGRTLARFHAALAGDFPPGKEGWLREDHPTLMRPYVSALRRLAADADQLAALDAINRQIDRVAEMLDGRLWLDLPRAVIHGDFHSGNIRFAGPRLAAIYDFDYASVQPRLRDLCDAVIAFASRRPSGVDPDDIRSLTQPFEPLPQPAADIFAAYHGVSPLVEAEWQALGWLIRSRWIQMRLRGSRKVSDADKLAFVLDGFFDVTGWLDRHSDAWLAALRHTCGSEKEGGPAASWTENPS